MPSFWYGREFGTIIPFLKIVGLKATCDQNKNVFEILTRLPIKAAVLFFGFMFLIIVSKSFEYKYIYLRNLWFKSSTLAKEITSFFRR